MSKESRFRRHYNRAISKGWAVPSHVPDPTFGDELWIQYWKAMQQYELGNQEGRPVPPHRSGGSRPVQPTVPTSNRYQQPQDPTVNDYDLLGPHHNEDEL